MVFRASVYSCRTSVRRMLFVNSQNQNARDPNYLWFRGFIEYEPMKLNFEIFLDRYILSQGSSFWEWNIYTAENYYRTHQGDED